MAELYFHKRCDQSAGPSGALPSHTTGVRPGLAVNVKPGATQLSAGEIALGLLASDPAIYFKDSAGDIRKLAIISHEGQAGLIEIAEQSEVDTGTDDYRAITPLKLVNFGGTFNNDITFAGKITTTSNIEGPGGLPSGMIIHSAAATVQVGWLECDGASYSATTYPELFAAIGTTYGGSAGNFNVPDLRNQFIRGLPAGGAQGNIQAESVKFPASAGVVVDAVADHNHGVNGSINPDGEHSHTAITLSDAGSHTHTMNGAGTHSHTIIDRLIGDGGGSIVASKVDNNGHVMRSAGQPPTTSAGNHAHTNDANGIHTHTVTVPISGSHSHVLNLNSSDAGAHTHTASLVGDDAETRPQNMHLKALIKT